MTAKEYLGQARFLDMRINSKIQQVASLNELATKCTATISDMPGNPNRGGSRMADAVIKIIDLQEEIKKNPNAKTEGFVTNESNAVGKVNTKSAVLDIAKKEVGEKFNKVNFAFDRTQGIWRVTFSMDTVTDENTTSEKIMTVYIDEDGYTLATIKA